MIVLSGPNGIRKIKENEEYKLEPGEKVIGAEYEFSEKRVEYWITDRLAAYFGVALADFIKMAAEALRIPHCSMCQMRYKVLYAIKQLGIIKATRLISKTLRGKDLTPEEVAEVERAFQNYST